MMRNFTSFGKNLEYIPVHEALHTIGEKPQELLCPWGILQHLRRISGTSLFMRTSAWTRRNLDDLPAKTSHLFLSIVLLMPPTRQGKPTEGRKSWFGDQTHYQSPLSLSVEGSLLSIPAVLMCLSRRRTMESGLLRLVRYNAIVYRFDPCRGMTRGWRQLVYISVNERVQNYW